MTENWEGLQTNQKLKWRAVHLLNYTTNGKLKELSKQIPGLGKMGINTIILEVDYHFDFQSHPELCQTMLKALKVFYMYFKPLH